MTQPSESSASSAYTSTKGSGFWASGCLACSRFFFFFDCSSAFLLRFAFGFLIGASSSVKVSSVVLRRFWEAGFSGTFLLAGALRVVLVGFFHTDVAVGLPSGVKLAQISSIQYRRCALASATASLETNTARERCLCASSQAFSSDSTVWCASIMANENRSYTVR